MFEACRRPVRQHAKRAVSLQESANELAEIGKLATDNSCVRTCPRARRHPPQCLLWDLILAEEVW